MTTPLIVSLTATRQVGVTRRLGPRLPARDASGRESPEWLLPDREAGAALAVVRCAPVAARRYRRESSKAAVRPRGRLGLRDQTGRRRGPRGVGRLPRPAGGRRRGGRGARVLARRSNGF